MGEITNQGIETGGFDLTQFHGVFFEEAAENLARMEALLVDIDVERATEDELNAVFRVAHSIKGGAATFGFVDVTELTHELETLLDRLRRRQLRLARATVDVLLEAGDVLRSQLARHQGTSSDSPDAADLVRRIKALAAGRDAGATAAGQRRLRLRVGPLDDAAIADSLAELFRDIPALGTLEPLDGGRLSAAGLREFGVLTASPDSELVELFSFHLSREQIRIEPFDAALSDAAAKRADVADGHADASVAAAGAGTDSLVAAQDDGYGFFVDPSTLPAARAAARRHATEQYAAGRGTGERRARNDRGGAHLESTTLRVSVEKVDQLINLVGELVITQAMLTQQIKDLDPVRFQTLVSGVSDLERHTRHLQESVMSIRMIPMAFVFSRFPRMLRDLASRLGKDIALKTVGDATELDKGLIEKIIDPLTHLVRNSADHGIETPAHRVAAGKPAAGTITLSAAHQGGSILIEVRDDGAGLRRERILAKAAERGLPVRDDMTDPEVWALIWEPGFSTAAELSDVSGRGVGMDVVRRNIAALGGTVELDSAAGYGTRVSVRLPLTLAIMDGMSIGIADETYILPLGSVVESFQVEEAMTRTIGSARVVRVRDEYLPVVSLDEVFAVPRPDGQRGAQIMVIVEAEGRRVAALVDELIGQQQVVVKNLESNYRRVPGVSGATILGDGRVALIIDVAGLVKRARH
jgi:two-component system chemotaxis sensor kinase CheA